MTQDKVDFFLMANSKYFPSSRLFFIKSRLKTMDDLKLMILSSIEYRVDQYSTHSGGNSFRCG